MIKHETLCREWILQFRKIPALKKSDPALIEKMIYAFYLLENLSKQSLDFIFKGGTSLILITGENNRFSVDVDISTTADKDKLEKVFHDIVLQSEFENFKLDEHRSYENSQVPKAHYFFHYQSNFNSRVDYILLDILFQDVEYPEINELEINAAWLLAVEPFLKVNTPSVNSILGDKLTAFAPNTTGVPYKKGKELEIVKQLFDVSKLINKADNYGVVSSSFLSIAKNEIQYRKISISTKEVLEDIFNTSLTIAKREKNLREYLRSFNEVKIGLLKISTYIIGKAFRIDEAIEASAKTAWFAMKLKNENFAPLTLYEPSNDLEVLTIENKEFQFLNKLKKNNKPAFYYWYKCLGEIDRLK